MDYGLGVFSITTVKLPALLKKHLVSLSECSY
jgi:hypothetical protein